MNPNRESLFALAVSILIFSSHVSANDGFIPGDAFFLSRLGDDSMRDWDSFLSGTSDNFVLKYKPSSDWAYIGPTAGHQQLIIKGVTRERVQILESLYRWLRKQPEYARSDITFYDVDGKKRTKEQGPFYLLVYNKSFGGINHALGQETSTIGLLYNELWMHGGVSVASRSPQKSDLHQTEGDSIQKLNYGMGGQSNVNEPLWQYRTLVPGSDAVVEDWKHAKDVPGLKVTATGSIPSKGEARQPVPNALEISFEDIQFIIVPQSPSVNDENFFESFHKKVEGSEVFIVIGDEIKRCQWKVDPESTLNETDLEILQLTIPQ